MDPAFTIHPIGIIRSPLKFRKNAPRQGYRGAPEAWLEVFDAAAPGLLGVTAGSELIVLTWLHEARRDVLQVRPHRGPDMPLTGVFCTRSPDRPNPIGLHRVTVREVNGTRLRIFPMEAIDGTPVVDMKTVLAKSDDG